MNHKDKMNEAYMSTTHVFAKCSHAKRQKVGAIVVKDDRVISIGYNGTPPGWDNCCEDEVFAEDHEFEGLNETEIVQRWPHVRYYGEFNSEAARYRLVTKPEVLHAEFNAIAKLAKSTESSDGAVMYCTLMPCYECAKLIHAAGIKTVYYQNIYRSDAGLRFLEKAGVQTIKIGDFSAATQKFEQNQ